MIMRHDLLKHFWDMSVTWSLPQPEILLKSQKFDNLDNKAQVVKLMTVKPDILKHSWQVSITFWFSKSEKGSEGTYCNELSFSGVKSCFSFIVHMVS